MRLYKHLYANQVQNVYNISTARKTQLVQINKNRKSTNTEESIIY